MAMVICVEAVVVITTDGIAVVDIIEATIGNDCSTHFVPNAATSPDEPSNCELALGIIVLSILAINLPIILGV